jgi:hypothetical protein
LLFLLPEGEGQDEGETSTALTCGYIFIENTLKLKVVGQHLDSPERGWSATQPRSEAKCRYRL